MRDAPEIERRERWGTARPAEIWQSCAGCGEGIAEGESYYTISRREYCYGCVSAMNGREVLSLLHIREQTAGQEEQR